MAGLAWHSIRQSSIGPTINGDGQRSITEYGKLNNQQAPRTSSRLERFKSGVVNITFCGGPEISGRGGKVLGVTTIINLRQLMQRKNATIQKLCDCAGVGYSTVQKARKGKPIQTFLACCIIETLAKKDIQFRYNQKGPR